MNKFSVIRNRKWIILFIGQLSYKSIQAIEVMQSNLNHFTNERLNGISMITQAVVTFQGPELSLGARAHHAYAIHFITITHKYLYCIERNYECI